jgi:hypothetical protein
LAPVCVCFGLCNLKFGCILPILFQLSSHRGDNVERQWRSREKHPESFCDFSICVDLYVHWEFFLVRLRLWFMPLYLSVCLSGMLCLLDRRTSSKKVQEERLVRVYTWALCEICSSGKSEGACWSGHSK